VKLEEKLSELEERREHMKIVNAAWRKAGKPAPDKAEAWTPVGEALGLTTEGLQKLRLQAARGFASDSPYPAYALTNIGSEVRRIRVRIEELRAAEGAQRIEEDHGACRMIEDPDDNRVRLFFDGKPSDAVRALLKRSGFRWSRYEGAWQRQLNNAGRAAARNVVRELKEARS